MKTLYMAAVLAIAVVAVPSAYAGPGPECHIEFDAMPPDASGSCDVSILMPDLPWGGTSAPTLP